MGAGSIEAAYLDRRQKGRLTAPVRCKEAGRKATLGSCVKMNYGDSESKITEAGEAEAGRSL